MTETTHLFVYGTLLTVADHPLGHRLRSAADYVGLGWIRACLYHVEDPDRPGFGYPGAVPSRHEHDRVHGELYALRDAHRLLAEVDIYEACDPTRPEPHEYLRRRVPVTLSSGHVVPAFCYFYGWDLSRATRVPSGQFNRGATPYPAPTALSPHARS